MLNRNRAAFCKVYTYTAKIRHRKEHLILLTQILNYKTSPSEVGQQCQAGLIVQYVRHSLMKPPPVSKLSQLLADPCTSVRLPPQARMGDKADPCSAMMPLRRLQRRPVRLQPNLI